MDLLQRFAAGEVDAFEEAAALIAFPRVIPWMLLQC